MSRHYTLSGTPTMPLTLEDAKKQLKIGALESTTENDDRITKLIVEAVDNVARYIGIKIAEVDFEIKSDKFLTEVESEFSPVTAVSEITYLDENGDQQTLDTTKYKLYNINELDSQIFYEDDPLPTLKDDAKAVTTTCKLGYEADKVPSSILSAINLELTYLYYHRDDRADMKVRASKNIARRLKRY